MLNYKEFTEHNNKIHKEWLDKDDNRLRQYINTANNPNRKLGCYKYRAKVRGIEFTIPDNICKEMFTKPCHYCGTRNNGFDSDCTSELLKVTYGKEIHSKLNGIDRLDNSLGYSENNTVTCCSVCNKIKGHMSELGFYLKCIVILYFQDYNIKIPDDLLRNLINLYDQNNQNHPTIYQKYKNSETDCLTEEEFNNICKLSDCCYLCGFKSDFLSLDRIDNSVGHTGGNCKSCCSSCNYMKSNFNYLTFLEHIYFVFST